MNPFEKDWTEDESRHASALIIEGEGAEKIDLDTRRRLAASARAEAREALFSRMADGETEDVKPYEPREPRTHAEVFAHAVLRQEMLSAVRSQAMRDFEKSLLDVPVEAKPLDFSTMTEAEKAARIEQGLGNGGPCEPINLSGGAGGRAVDGGQIIFTSGRARFEGATKDNNWSMADMAKLAEWVKADRPGTVAAFLQWMADKKGMLCFDRDGIMRLAAEVAPGKFLSWPSIFSPDSFRERLSRAIRFLDKKCECGASAFNINDRNWLSIGCGKCNWFAGQGYWVYPSAAEAIAGQMENESSARNWPSGRRRLGCRTGLRTTS